jgi:hypothetical protein
MRWPVTRLGIGISCALGLALSVPCLFSPLFDDAYIHARIAEQLLRTGNPAFNPGTVLKTDSSTGYLLLLTGATFVMGSAVSALRAIQALCVLFYVPRLYLLAKALSGRPTFVHGALIVCALPPLLWAAYGGMETSCAALCLLLGATASLGKRQEKALFYLCCAASLRLELLPIPVGYAGFVLFRERQPLRALRASLPLLACLAFDLVCYRSVLPHAARAKSIAYDLPFEEAAQLAVSVGFEREAWALSALQAAALSLSLAAALRRRSPSFLVDLLALECAFLIAAWTLSQSIMFPWYVATFSSCTSIIALFWTRSAQASDAPPRELQVSRAVFSALQASLGSLAALCVLVDLGWAEAEMASGVRAQRYLGLGERLFAQCATCSLLSSEIGGIGYGFRGHIHDALGLADLAALPLHPLSVPAQRSSYRVGAIPPDYVLLRDPDFVISMPLFSEAFRRSTAVRPFSIYDCPLVPEQPTRSLWGDTVIQIFAKRPLNERVLREMRCAPHARSAH